MTHVHSDTAPGPNHYPACFLQDQ